MTRPCSTSLLPLGVSATSFGKLWISVSCSLCCSKHSLYRSPLIAFYFSSALLTHIYPDSTWQIAFVHGNFFKFLGLSVAFALHGVVCTWVKLYGLAATMVIGIMPHIWLETKLEARRRTKSGLTTLWFRTKRRSKTRETTFWWVRVLIILFPSGTPSLLITGDGDSLRWMPMHFELKSISFHLQFITFYVKNRKRYKIISSITFPLDKSKKLNFVLVREFTKPNLSLYHRNIFFSNIERKLFELSS